jgi:hypothetical protein
LARVSGIEYREGELRLGRSLDLPNPTLYE